MKKFLLYTINLSLLFFQSQASEHTPEEFFQTEITREYINYFYPEFIKHTEKQYNTMKNKTTQLVVYIGSWLTKTSPDDVIQNLAGIYGYDNASKRLLGIGKLVLDMRWNERLEMVLQNCKDEHIQYLNEAKQYVRDNIMAEYNTYAALNQAMRYTHEFHVNALQKEQLFDEEYANFLKRNSLKNKDGLYPMHAYLEQYKKEHQDEIHPYVIWNMFLAYLFALHKVTTPGS